MDLQPTAQDAAQHADSRGSPPAGPAFGALDWTHVPAEQVLPGVTRQRVDGAHVTVIRYVYQPGAKFPTHAHPEEQTTVVLTGRIEFGLGARRLTLGPGDTALIPADLPHDARVLGAAVVETVNVMSPVRRSDVIVAS